MKQPSLVTKVSEEVPKTRKLGSNRNIFMQSKNNSKQLSRLKSNQDGPTEEATKSKLTVKPRSSKGWRPLSSQKLFQATTTKTNTTASSSSKSEEEVREIIYNIFMRSMKVQQFLQEKNLDQRETLNSLVNNELFTLSLVSGISDKDPEEVNKYVQKCCISKLERTLQMEKQKVICEHLQNKIESLIDKRLKALNNFS